MGRVSGVPRDRRDTPRVARRVTARHCPSVTASPRLPSSLPFGDSVSFFFRFFPEFKSVLIFFLSFFLNRFLFWVFSSACFCVLCRLNTRAGAFEETRGGGARNVGPALPLLWGERPSAEALSFVFSISFSQGLGVGPGAFPLGRSVFGAVGPSSLSLLRGVSRPRRAAGLPSRPALCAPTVLSGPPCLGLLLQGVPSVLRHLPALAALAPPRAHSPALGIRLSIRSPFCL